MYCTGVYLSDVCPDYLYPDPKNLMNPESDPVPDQCQKLPN